MTVIVAPFVVPFSLKRKTPEEIFETEATEPAEVVIDDVVTLASTSVGTWPKSTST